MEYTQNERIEIIKFIEENFGKVEEIYEVGYGNFSLDVAQINPTKVFFRILLLINFLSILYIVIKVFKNKEPKRKIIYSILSHSEWLIFF